MSKTEVSGKQVQDGTIELLDLSSTLQSTINGKADSSSLATVATSGSYNDLLNKPSLGSLSGSLDDLSDVAVSSAATGQFIVHNGTQFVNSNTIEASGAAVKPLVVKGVASQTANLFEVDNSSGADMFVVQAAGTVSIQTSASVDGNTGMTATNFSASGAGSEINLRKSRGAAIGTNTIVNAGDYVGGVRFWGANGTGYTQAAVMAVAVDGTPGASNDMPGRFEWYTQADGSGGYSAERMRLNSAGNLGIGTTGTPGARLHVDLSGNGNPAAPATKGLLVKGAASQTANLFEVDNSTDANMFEITPTGRVVIQDRTGDGTATSLFVNSTNIFSRLLTLRANASQSANMVELQNSAGTVLSSFDSGGQLNDNGIAVVSYREYETVLGTQEGNSSRFNLAYGLQTVWKNGVQQTAGTHYTQNGNYTQWTTGNVPTASDVIEIFGVPWTWRGSSGNGTGFGYFPTAAIGTQRPGTSSTRAALTVATPAAARKGIVIRGAASQSENFLEMQNSAGTPIFFIQSTGRLWIKNTNSSDSIQLGFSTNGDNQYGMVCGVNPGSGYQSTYIGAYAGQRMTGTSNTAVGTQALWGQGGASGGYNTGVGERTGYFLTTGQVNGLFGYEAGYNISTGQYNVGFGANAAYNISTGSHNVCLGTSSGPVAGAATNSHQIAIGSGASTSGDYALAIGRNASAAANSLDIRFGNASRITGDSSGNIAIVESLNAKRFVETSTNAFSTSLAPSSGTLTVDSSVGNVVFGALSASVTTWAFTNVPADNSRVTTVTVILEGNASFTYGDACSVNGSAVTNGVRWSGGAAPTATSGTDIITFVIARDSAGTIRVFGSATTNFS